MLSESDPAHITNGTLRDWYEIQYDYMDNSTEPSTVVPPHVDEEIDYYQRYEKTNTFFEGSDTCLECLMPIASEDNMGNLTEPMCSCSDPVPLSIAKRIDRNTPSSLVKGLVYEDDLCDSCSYAYDSSCPMLSERIIKIQEAMLNHPDALGLDIMDYLDREGVDYLKAFTGPAIESCDSFVNAWDETWLDEDDEVTQTSSEPLVMNDTMVQVIPTQSPSMD